MIRVSTYKTPIEFDDIWQETAQRRKRILAMVERFPDARHITIAECSGPPTRLRPRPGEAIYVMASRNRRPARPQINAHPSLTDNGPDTGPPV